MNALFEPSFSILIMFIPLLLAFRKPPWALSAFRLYAVVRSASTFRNPISNHICFTDSFYHGYKECHLSSHYNKYDPVSSGSVYYYSQNHYLVPASLRKYTHTPWSNLNSFAEQYTHTPWSNLNSFAEQYGTCTSEYWSPTLTHLMRSPFHNFESIFAVESLFSVIVIIMFFRIRRMIPKNMAIPRFLAFVSMVSALMMGVFSATPALFTNSTSKYSMYFPVNASVHVTFFLLFALSSLVRPLFMPTYWKQMGYKIKGLTYFCITVVMGYMGERTARGLGFYDPNFLHAIAFFQGLIFNQK